ncbi:CDP-diacylglycerol--glycerol-3-phosphate 3-phosphatidyltransferase [Asticcacaulis sp. BYS171W]|uniref:CDP-diacylglycerol--glycerol-3-phosphate 3-phosphatidyltransferase n=1 Tax=Asticcacaulis aquaticus TaxID=2984212 RepID=A0ABT5HVI8_9CAUL|nr:CDP-diacylglycerol--glycerol-3-phosphate 3-phosphatidyltransferase [Asticcacaulis aquaticus]MDC7683979.1 CDP-diacylglycerol--glycerol-3-phosphate 3-phosphatidyltransferase [Asticcacaulis aquaticus]
MTSENVNPIPNILTSLRLLLGIVMFLLMAVSGDAVPLISVMPDMIFGLQRWAFALFVIAASTDFLDGYLARRLNAVSKWGSILDPIADKILVCGTILGLFAMHKGDPIFVLPGAIILFREFAVSSLRESVAGRGISLPVTLLSKWKTTLQMVALGALLLTESWAAFKLTDLMPLWYDPFFVGAYIALWLAAVISVWTGAAYFIGTKHQL